MQSIAHELRRNWLRITILVLIGFLGIADEVLFENFNPYFSHGGLVSLGI